MREDRPRPTPAPSPGGEFLGAVRPTMRIAGAVAAGLIFSSCGGSSSTTAETGAAGVIVERSASALEAATATVEWTFLANENESFKVKGKQVVRFGSDKGWVKKTMKGAGTCSTAFFGVDPAPGKAKHCELKVVPPPPPPPPPSPVVYVNPALIPAVNQNPVGGWSQDMLLPTTEVAPPSDIGAFRTGCQVSKFAFDDPIVFPGQPGKSHLHTFFGNTGVNASSTADSLATTGNSTCRGGTINRSAYWVPSMVDTRTGAPLAPMFESNFYYKTGYALPPSAITAMPPGLRMIAGDAKGTPEAPSSAVMYACVWDGGNGNWQNSIPTSCPVVGTSWLIMAIDFPQCWDGVNLDAPDHISHMANPVNVKANNTGNCPSSHPVAIPQISFQVLYQLKAAGETQYWRLASDNYDLTQPAGHSGHGDWFNGWKPEIVDVWVKNCDRAQRDCHSHLLGDGRMMVIP